VISHHHKCIFIHIPKCAGSSIERALGHNDNGNLPVEPDHRSIRMLERPIPISTLLLSPENLLHLALRLRHKLRSHHNPNNTLTLSPDQYESYFKFTVVRNPWSRAYSWYRNCMRDPNHRKRFGLDDETTLFAFLRKQVGRGALRSQLSSIKSFSGRIDMDQIVRFETLDADFGKICEALNLSDLELPHVLKGGGDDYRGHFDGASKQLVGRKYIEEIERFGYTFEA